MQKKKIIPPIPRLLKLPNYLNCKSQANFYQLKRPPGVSFLKVFRILKVGAGVK